jgi:hypothetical protein
MLMMCIGFFVARRLSVWAVVALVLVLELVPLVAIRDDLTLNIINLIAPSAAIAAWQARG